MKNVWNFARRKLIISKKRIVINLLLFIITLPLILILLTVSALSITSYSPLLIKSIWQELIYADAQYKEVDDFPFKCVSEDAYKYYSYPITITQATNTQEYAALQDTSEECTDENFPEIDFEEQILLLTSSSSRCGIQEIEKKGPFHSNTVFSRNA